MANSPGISVLIVEDELIVATDLQESLEQEGYHVIGIASDGETALRLYQAENIDLVLLDINIKGDWDGIETSRRLMSVKQRPFIYLTAYADNATFERAKETHPSAYLLKPFHLPSLRMAIELAFTNFRKQQPATTQPTIEASKEKDVDYFVRMHDAIFIRHRGRHVKVQLDDIIYLSADSNHVQIHTGANLYTLRRSLQSLMEEFVGSALVRVHRSYAVNSARVEKMQPNQLQIAGVQIPLGRSYKEAFLQQIKVLG